MQDGFISMDPEQESLTVIVDGLVISIQRWVLPGNRSVKVFVDEGTCTKNVELRVADNNANSIAKVLVHSNEDGWEQINYRMMEGEL